MSALIEVSAFARILLGVLAVTGLSAQSNRTGDRLLLPHFTSLYESDGRTLVLKADPKPSRAGSCWVELGLAGFVGGGGGFSYGLRETCRFGRLDFRTETRYVAVDAAPLDKGLGTVSWSKNGRFAIVETYSPSSKWEIVDRLLGKRTELRDGGALDVSDSGTVVAGRGADSWLWRDGTYFEKPAALNAGCVIDPQDRYLICQSPRDLSLVSLITGEVRKLVDTPEGSRGTVRVSEKGDRFVFQIPNLDVAQPVLVFSLPDGVQTHQLNITGFPYALSGNGRYLFYRKRVALNEPAGAPMFRYDLNTGEEIQWAACRTDRYECELAPGATN